MGSSFFRELCCWYYRGFGFVVVVVVVVFPAIVFGLVVNNTDLKHVRG